MRLFVAVLFDDNILEQLNTAVLNLREHSQTGTFTHKENLHLTLTFIGESTRSEAVIRAIDEVEAEQFTLKLGGLGRFRRDSGDIYWIGVERSAALLRLQQELTEHLLDSGFAVEQRPYKPHLTLGRRVNLDAGVDVPTLNRGIKPINMQVRRISLMRSERIQGRLTYSEIYGRDL